MQAVSFVLTASLLVGCGRLGFDGTDTQTGNEALTVIAPNGGELWDGGSVQMVRWTDESLDAATAIDLEYSLDGVRWNVIVRAVPNTGSYAWTVPFLDSWSAFSGSTLGAWTAADVLDREHVRVRATAVEVGVSDISDGDFGVVLSEPAVELVPLNASNGRGYVVYKPEGYDQRATWPTILFLPGAGALGDGTLAALPSVIHYVTPGGSDDGGTLKWINQVGVRVPFVVIAPQIAVGQSFDTAEFTAVDRWPRFWDHVKANYKLDLNRVVATGLSLGGGGVWNLAAERLGEVAAIVPVSGANSGTERIQARAQAILDDGVEIWTFHAIDDMTVNVRDAVLWTQLTGIALGDAGAGTFEAPMGPFGVSTTFFNGTMLDEASGQLSMDQSPILFTWFETGDHTEATFDRAFGARATYDWMLEQSR